MNNDTILIGTDPELFIFDSALRHHISAHGLVPGDKSNPFLVFNGAVQLDGVAAEFNIFPTSDRREFLERIRSVENQLLEIVQEKLPTAQLDAIPTVHFSPEYFATVPKSSKVLGCQPDYNAWTGEINQKPRPRKPMRTGAGHIHIGFTEGANGANHFVVCREIVRALDMTLYPISLLWDTDRERQDLYGAPGAFRPKHYGLEYRPISNAYLRSDEVVLFCHDVCTAVARQVLNMDMYVGEDDFEDFQKLRPSELVEYYDALIEGGLELPEIPGVLRALAVQQEAA